MSARGRSRRRSGTTLVELIVGLTLFAIILTLSMQISAPLNQIGLRLWKRARAVAELRSALEHLRQDVGAAISVTAAGASGLVVEREPGILKLIDPAAPESDPGIFYRLEGERLHRTDLLLDEDIVVARDLSAFAVSTSGTELHVEIQAGAGQGQRGMHLVWRP